MTSWKLVLRFELTPCGETGNIDYNSGFVQ